MRRQFQPGPSLQGDNDGGRETPLVEGNYPGRDRTLANIMACIVSRCQEAGAHCVPQLPGDYPANTKNKAVPSTISVPAVINGTAPLGFDVNGMIVNGRNSPQKTSESARAFVGRAPWPNCIRRRFLCRYFRAIDESPLCPGLIVSLPCRGLRLRDDTAVSLWAQRFIILKINSTEGIVCPDPGAISSRSR
jgi:hypothetical protein